MRSSWPPQEAALSQFSELPVRASYPAPGRGLRTIVSNGFLKSAGKLLVSTSFSAVSALHQAVFAALPVSGQK